MNVRKMIEETKEQITVLEQVLVSLEKIESLSTGAKRRGRPLLPRCEKGCGRPVHKGRCHSLRLTGWPRNLRRTVERG